MTSYPHATPPVTTEKSVHVNQRCQRHVIRGLDILRHGISSELEFDLFPRRHLIHNRLKGFRVWCHNRQEVVHRPQDGLTNDYLVDACNELLKLSHARRCGIEESDVYVEKRQAREQPKINIGMITTNDARLLQSSHPLGTAAWRQADFFSNFRLGNPGIAEQRHEYSPIKSIELWTAW